MDKQAKIDFLNEKHAELIENQEQELILDFDEALKEYKTKIPTFKIKFKGEFYNIPTEMPFSFSMFYMRNCLVTRNGKTVFEIPDDKFKEFISLMFGTKFLAQLEKVENDDVTFNFVIGKMIPEIMEKWIGQRFQKTTNKELKNG